MIGTNTTLSKDASNPNSNLTCLTIGLFSSLQHASHVSSAIAESQNAKRCTRQIDSHAVIAARRATHISDLMLDVLDQTNDHNDDILFLDPVLERLHVRGTI